MNPKYPDILVKLTERDGNAYVILYAVMSALKKAGVPKEEIDAFEVIAKSGNYDHLLQTVMEWVTVE
jgi:hypothetical protein